MRGTFGAIGLAIGLLAVGLGCHHDKYNMKPPKVEEYQLPPDEKRYNQPDTAPYKKPPPAKEVKTLLGRPGGGGFSGGGGPGGF
jgi:hypothetical protein